MFAKVNRRLNPSYPSWIKAGNSTPEFIQPLLTLKESEGLNLTEWYWPELRAPRSLGRGRPSASSLALACSPPSPPAAPAPPQAPIAETPSVARSPSPRACIAIFLLGYIRNRLFRPLLHGSYEPAHFTLSTTFCASV